jgi:hypothetical protein
MSRWTSRVFLLIITIGPSMAWALTSWQDPGGVFAQGKQLLVSQAGAENFDGHYTCGEPVIYNSAVEHIELTCTDLYCKSVIQHPIGDRRQIEIVAEGCADGAVSIFGSNGLDVRLDRAGWDLTGSWLTGLLNAFSVFVTPMGSFKVIGVSETLHRWIEGGRRTDIPTLTYRIEFYAGTPQVALDLEVVIVPQWTGIRRVALVKGDGDDFLRLPGLVDRGHRVFRLRSFGPGGR